MYFENIYHNIKPLWKKLYSLGDVNETETYIANLANDWEEIDFLVSHKLKEKYNEWEKMMLFIMYQVLTEYGLEQYELSKEIIDIDDIPLERFEKKYLDNLHYEGNEEYLKEYKGLKKLRIDFES